MIHYTLNTAHSRQSPRSEVSDGVLPQMARYLTPGEHDLPIEGWTAKTSTADGGCVCTVSYEGLPVATFGVAPDSETAERLWPVLEQMYLRITDQPGFRAADFAAPKQPSKTPWCAVVLIAPIACDWLGDFERCLAWAWIERAKETE